MIKETNGRTSDNKRIRNQYKILELYSFLYEKVDDYGGTNTSNIILILSESQHKDVLVVDKEITFILVVSYKSLE